MSRISTCEKQKLRIQELEKKNRSLENEIRERRQIEKNLEEISGQDPLYPNFSTERWGYYYINRHFRVQTGRGCSPCE